LVGFSRLGIEKQVNAHLHNILALSRISASFNNPTLR
jgi:hypothetical protein